MTPFAIFLLLPAFQEETVPDLIRRLADPDVKVREKASAQIRARGEPALADLRKAIDHEDPEVRARIADLVFAIEWESTLNPMLLVRYPELREALDRHSHQEIFEFATNHPSWEGFRDRFEAYAIKLLGQPASGLKKMAAEFLYREKRPFHGGPRVMRRPIRELVREIEQWTPEAWDDAGRKWLRVLGWTAVLRVSPADRPLLAMSRASHPDAGRVLDLLRACAGDGEGLRELAGILDTVPEWLQILALEVIREIRFAPALPGVIKVFEMQKEEKWANMALAEIADRTCEGAYLRQFLKWREKAPLLQFDLKAMTRIRTPPVIAVLEDILRTGPGPMRHAVAEALQWGEEVPDLFDALCDAMRDGDRACAAAAARLADGRTIGRLLGMLDSGDLGRREAVSFALPWVKHPDAQREVTRRLETEKDAAIRKSILDAVTQEGFIHAGGGGLEGVLRRIVRDPADPLAARAAEFLLRLEGDSGRAAAEDVFLAADVPDLMLLKALCDYPSDRLVERAAKLATHGTLGEDAFVYLERAGARGALSRISREAKTDPLRFRALSSLFKTGGGELPLPEGAMDRFNSPIIHDMVKFDAPGAREFVWRQLRERPPEKWYVDLLADWAPPEAVPGLLKILAGNEAGRHVPRAEDEVPMIGCFFLGGNDAGCDAMRALAATGERSVPPVLLARLRSPHPDLQIAAIRSLGRLRIAEAVPALRQMVLSGNSYERVQAIQALADIGAPGTVEFLRAHLRDNAIAAPRALAQLGHRGIDEVAALLEDDVPRGPILGAMDFMAHPEAYVKIGSDIPPYQTGCLKDIPRMLRTVLGVPSRLSPEVRARLRAHDEGISLDGIRTIREALCAMSENQSYYGGYCVHLYREGAIEICTDAEAREWWKERRRR